jgi:enoyl-CoA hydratase/carnithine racemase
MLCEENPAAKAAEWGSSHGRFPPRSSTRRSTAKVEKLVSKLPQTMRYTKQQLNWWRDLSWHETVDHAREWLAMSMLGDEAKDAIRAFLER